MTREELQDLREQTPFVPFTLVTVNHQRYDVDHPDFLLLPPAPPNPDAKHWPSHVIHYDQTGRFRFISLGHLVTAEFQPERGP